MNKTVIEHFDEQAYNYHGRSRGFLWNWLRQRESKAVFDLLGTVAGKTVVDLGCGSGYYTKLALEYGAKHVIAIDAATSMVKALPPQNVTGLVADATSVQLGQHFDKIICAGLLEFASDPKAVLANARTLAADSGIMSLLVPRQNLWVEGYKFYHTRHGVKIKTFSERTLAEIGVNCGWHINNTRLIFPFTLVLCLKAI